MNILWLSHMVPYPPKGGSFQRSFNLLRQYAKRHEVSLLAFNQKAVHSDRRAVDECIRALSEFCVHVEVFDIQCERSRVSKMLFLLGNLIHRLPYSVDMLDSNAMLTALKRVLAGRSIDLVHFDAIDVGEFLVATRAVRNVLNHHNVESQLLARRAEALTNPLARLYVRLQARKLALYERQRIGQFDLNLVVSELDRDQLLRHSPSARVEVVDNGVDVEYFRPSAESPRRDHVLFVGGLGWFPNRDGVTYFIREIWDLVKAELPDAALTLVGRRPEEVQHLTRRADIRAVGFVEDVRPYLHMATVFVAPLRVGGGTRVKILDALASGKAVVSTSIGCEGLAVTPGRHILVADSPREFARQVIRVCNDDQLRRQLGDEGRRLVERRYSWPGLGAHLDELVSSVVLGGR